MNQLIKNTFSLYQNNPPSDFLHPATAGFATWAPEFLFHILQLGHCSLEPHPCLQLVQYSKSAGSPFNSQPTETMVQFFFDPVLCFNVIMVCTDFLKTNAKQWSVLKEVVSETRWSQQRHSKDLHQGRWESHKSHKLFANQLYLITDFNRLTFCSVYSTTLIYCLIVRNTNKSLENHHKLCINIKNCKFTSSFNKNDHLWGNGL